MKDLLDVKLSGTKITEDVMFIPLKLLLKETVWLDTIVGLVMVKKLKIVLLNQKLNL
jgi:hypothetical protein